MRKAFTTLFLLFLGFFSAFAQKSYNSLMHEGNQLFKDGKYDAAASRYMEALKTNQKDFAAHYNLANSLYKSKKYEEAKAEYEKASQLSSAVPDKAAALHNLGNTYMQMKQPEKAAEYYKQSLKQAPYSEPTRKNYEIAKLKDKENQQKKQDSGKGGGGGKGQQQQGQVQGDKQGQSQANGQGNQQQNNGQGNAGERQGRGTMPKGEQDAIINRASNRERETAKRILNKNSYSIPESNEKDW